jgi:hypothetical protein
MIRRILIGMATLLLPIGRFPPVAGIARYGGRPRAVKILSEMFEAADHFAMRLPELSRLEDCSAATKPKHLQRTTWTCHSRLATGLHLLIRHAGSRSRNPLNFPTPPGISWVSVPAG